MDGNESFVYKILKKNENGGIWNFVDLKPQSKIYPSLGFWVAYPDFEFYSDKKLLLLVEAKGYHGFFDGRENTIAMKKRHFNSYKIVQEQEGVEVRIAFVMRIWKTKKIVFWESLSNIKDMPYYIEKYTYDEKDFDTGITVKKREDFIFWDIKYFRTDEDNLAIK